MNLPQSPPILSRPAAHVALIELNRPDAANRLQRDDLATLIAHLDACESDEQLHALVLAANGRHFSAGFDLRALLADLESGRRESRGDTAFEAVAERLASSRLITIAAINGPVHGGATDLALACDLRIGTDAAQLQMPAARFGLPLYASALQRYVNRLGLDTAKRLVFLAQKIDAHEMLRIGFLSEMVGAEELRAHALTLAGAITDMPPRPLAAMKQVLNAAALGRGTAAEQRAALAAAFDAKLIAERIAAMRPRNAGA
jgi:enoyl-CoA hydratase